MLLFQADAFGALLHTGDCRLDAAALAALRAHLDEALGEGARLDALWLDATMGDAPHVVGCFGACGCGGQGTWGASALLLSAWLLMLAPSHS